MSEETRALAAHAFNAAWDALEAREYESAVALARESLRLWSLIGGLREICLGNWMLGRTLAYAGDFSAARIATEEAEANLELLGVEAEDWLHASIAEMHARAHSNEPNSTIYVHFYEITRSLIAGILDPEDRDLIAAQFADLPRPSPA